jgi:post-segregation antitoxin (ccd killing protein)
MKSIQIGNVIRRTVSLSLAADRVLVEYAKKTGLKISTIIERAIMEMIGK